MVRNSIGVYLLFAVFLIWTVSAVQSVAAEPDPSEHIIEIVGFKYIPDTLSVKAGDTVVWINKDIVPHTATADDLSFDTGELKKDESTGIVVTKDMTLSYYCIYHPSMRASLSLE